MQMHLGKFENHLLNFITSISWATTLKFLECINKQCFCIKRREIRKTLKMMILPHFGF